MADSFTPNLNLRKPEVGAAFDTWGGAAGLNADLDLLDAIFLATGLGTSVGLHVGAGKVLKIDGTGELSANIDGVTLFDRTDPTKLAKLSAAGITTATTRTYTLPDANGTVALLDDVAKRAPRGTILYGYYGATAPVGTLFLNGTTFGKGTSVATQRANDDTWLLYEHFWVNLNATPTGGRGASALADFDANKPMPLPDHRGRAAFGLDNNGGIASANILTPGGGPNATVRGGAVGQSTEQASVSGVPVSVSVNGSTLGGAIVGTMTTDSPNVGMVTGNLGGGGTFEYASSAHTHVIQSNGKAVAISGTALGSGTVDPGSVTGSITNVPPGMATDCVIVM